MPGDPEAFFSDRCCSVTIATKTAITTIHITTWFYSSETALEFVSVDLDNFQVLHLNISILF